MNLVIANLLANYKREVKLVTEGAVRLAKRGYRTGRLDCDVCRRDACGVHICVNTELYRGCVYWETGPSGQLPKREFGVAEMSYRGKNRRCR
eukprot:scaffold420_cov404-Prasinococcus_capsulatus_cf.AAC.12